MLDPTDLEKIDEAQSAIHGLLDEVVKEFAALSEPQKQTVMKVVRGLDNSWDRLLADVGEREVPLPEKSLRALVACGCVMACMVVVQADDEISAAEREFLLRLTDRLSDSLSLGGLSPVSTQTTAGTVELYSHLVDVYDVMDHRIAGTLCAAIDAFRQTKLMAKFARHVTRLGTQISFVDGEQADQRELAVLQDFEETMKQVNELIQKANL